MRTGTVLKCLIAPALLLPIQPLVSRMTTTQHFRPDGVRITHDPYAPGMAEKYGMPGRTDNEGFDPYRDTVGPGIYGGIVERDPNTGLVVVGKQYQNHNSRPGPVYAGGGYTPVNRALGDEQKLEELLLKYPDLVNDISTGGAQPLHMCGMGGAKQGAVSKLVKFGADIEALETYGMTPLHRMASNNLAQGARALLEAGADAENMGRVGQTPMQIAQQSRAAGVIKVLKEWTSKGGSWNNIERVNVMGCETDDLDGDYLPRDAATVMPEGFEKVCREQKWDPSETWNRLADAVWFAKESGNGSYIYWNKADKRWWIDGPDGLGVFIVDGPKHAPPAHGWQPVSKDNKDFHRPMVRTFRLPPSPAVTG